MKILVLRGDGIGPEIVDATIKVLKTISKKFTSTLSLKPIENEKFDNASFVKKLLEKAKG